MVTQLVMLSTIVILSLNGFKLLFRSKKYNLPSVRIFAYGLFFVALAILFYVIRDIFVQFERYDIQTQLLTIGGFLHIIGAYLMLWFFTKEFAPKTVKYVFYTLFGLALVSFGFFVSGKLFKIESEIQNAPLEPFPYQVVRNYITDPVGIAILYGVIFIISFLILVIIIYNSLRIKEKKIKGLLYGFGAGFLVVPMIVCALYSPIFARIGYLIGSILIYQAFKIKG